MKTKVKSAILSLLLAAVLLAAGWRGLAFVSAQGAGDPSPGTVVGVKTVEFAAGSTAIAATTYYYGSGNGTTGLDTRFWHSADLFVTADISGTNTITVTPQWSADGSNWVSAKYKSEGWVLPLSHSTTITNASGVTNTTTSTHTITFASSTASRSSEDVTYRLAISADGSDAIAFPIRGTYLRLMAEVASAVNITPTINVILRNDGGH